MKPKKNPRNKSIRLIEGATLTFCAVQGLIAINNGAYWDGVMDEYAFAAHRPDYLWRLYIESSLPTQYVVHWALAHLPYSGVIHKFLAFAALAIIGISTVRFSRIALLCSERQAAFAALITVIAPLYSVLVSIVLLPYISFAACLFAGWYLYAAHEDNGSIKVVAYGLMILAFFYNSTLVLHFCFLLAIAASQIPNSALFTRDGLKALVSGVLSRPVLVLMPIAFYALKLAFYPAYGPMFEDYNKLLLFSGDGLVHVLHSLRGFVSFIPRLFIPLHTSWILYPIALVALLPALFAIMKYTSVDRPEDIGAYRLLLAGVLFLAGAIFPYAAVADSPIATDWTARHGMLLGPGLGFLVVGGISKIQLNVSGTVARQIVFVGLTAIVATDFAAGTLYNHLLMEADSAKRHAIVRALKKRPPIAPGTVVSVDDQFVIGYYAYRFYEYNFLIFEAWRATNWLAVRRQDADGGVKAVLAKYQEFISPKYRDQYVLSGFVPNNCLAEMQIVKSGNPERPELIGTHYLFLRVFRAASIPQFLDGLLSVRLGPTVCDGSADK
jgi:hypothetical protein